MAFRFRTPRTSESKPAGPGCKAGVTLFFLLFFGMGLLFTIFMIKEGLSTLNTYRWNKTPCTITLSYVDVRDSNENPYRFIVQYRYLYKERELIDSTYKRSYKGGEDYTKQYRLSQTYPKGGRAFCYVNPSNPEEALLKREAPLTLLFIFFPLIFVAIGAGGIYAIWSKRFAGTSITSRAKRKDPDAKRRKGRLLLGVFIFLLILGGVLSWTLCYRPIKNIVTAKSRLEIPCLVKSSHVRSHEGDDSTTYSVDILYEYEVGGKTYLSNKYIFIGGSSSGYSGKKAIVKLYAPGTHHTCFINAGDPADAVLNRGFRPIYLVLLIPIVVFLIGLSGTWSQMKKRREASAGNTFHPVEGGGAGSYTFMESGPVVLKSAASPLMKWVGAIIFCLFWNGIVSVFVWQAWLAVKAGRPEWFLMIFLIPFVLVGLVAVGLIFYYFLALFNPRPFITLGTRALALGSSTELSWRVKGRRGVIGSFSVTLEGREEATYRRGTDTHTDTKVFLKLPVVTYERGLPMAKGRETLSIPRDTMHSFASTHNKITWHLKVHGDIARWPDVEEEFLLEIQPLSEREIQR